MGKLRFKAPDFIAGLPSKGNPVNIPEPGYGFFTAT